MSALGNIQLVGEDQKDVKSDSVLYYDLANLKGTVFGAETQFMQGGTTWRIVGDVIPKAQDTVYASQGAFTSCDVEVPHYRFQAGEIKLVNQDVIVAWPVVLYVSNVPVFWLPFFAQDIRPGRRSGILPPRFGFNDVVQTGGSSSRNVTDFGYYWAINDYTDLEGSVDWFSGNYTRLNGVFRYRFLKQFIRGSIAYGETFSETGRNLTLGLNHDQELGLATTLRVSGRYIQDTRTFQDQTFDPRLQTQSIDSDAGLNHRFSFANLSVSARRRQFLTSDRTELTLPQFNLSFSPVTLFAAPRSREGLFNNMTLSGTGRFGRQSTSQQFATDRANTTGSFSGGLRLKQLNISAGANYNEVRTTEEDSTGIELPSVDGAPDGLECGPRLPGQSRRIDHAAPQRPVGRRLLSFSRYGGGFRFGPHTDELWGHPEHRCVRVLSGFRIVQSDPPQVLARLLVGLCAGRRRRLCSRLHSRLPSRLDSGPSHAFDQSAADVRSQGAGQGGGHARQLGP